VREVTGTVVATGLLPVVPIPHAKAAAGAKDSGTAETSVQRFYESLTDAVAWLPQTGPVAASGDGTERTMLLIGLAPDDVRMRRALDGRRESEVK
jgi:hypothetical protein